MTWHSPMPFAQRWKSVKEQRRDRLRYWLTDLIYLLSGFHL